MIKVRMVEEHTGEFIMTNNGEILEVPYGGSKSYLEASWIVMKIQE